MTQEDIYEKLKAIVVRNAPRNVAGSIDHRTELERAGIDSAHRLDILLDIEDAFQVSIDEAIFSKTRTIGDMAAVVSEHLEVSV